MPDGPIVFYDGVCALCNFFVKFATKRDKAGALYFAPLQGDTAAELRETTPGFPRDIISLVVVDDGRAHIRSDGALVAMRELPGPWRFLAAVGRVIPRVLRDALYDLVAATRYRLFGKYDECPVPPPEVRRRFLP
jgi:predicted DCC family thiol-disulfide oxidoreductase YuxK